MIPKNDFNSNYNENSDTKAKDILSPKLDVIFQILFGEVGSERITKDFLILFDNFSLNIYLSLSKDFLLNKNRTKSFCFRISSCFLPCLAQVIFHLFHEQIIPARSELP